MYKPPFKILPSYAKRRNAIHVLREFLRGAGAGATKRGSGMFGKWCWGVLIGGIASVAIPVITPLVVVAAAGSLTGIAAYRAVQRSAAIAHRIANKGIPEAPSRNRKAQAWGRRATNAFAMVACLGVSGVTAGVTVVALMQPTKVRMQSPFKPKPKFNGLTQIKQQQTPQVPQQALRI